MWPCYVATQEVVRPPEWMKWDLWQFWHSNRKVTKITFDFLSSCLSHHVLLYFCLFFLHFSAPFRLIRIPRIRITKRHTLTASFLSCHITIIYRYKLPSEIMGREDDLPAVCFANVPGVWSLHHPLSALFYTSNANLQSQLFFTKPFFVINLKVYFQID